MTTPVGMFFVMPYSGWIWGFEGDQRRKSADRSNTERQISGSVHGSDPVARQYGHDPYVQLKNVLTRLPTQRASEADQLLPPKWQPIQSRKA